MKFISWNVNGLRACLEKGFGQFFEKSEADFICIQETKMQPGQATFQPEGYFQYWNSAIRKGYSGTAVFTKHEPLSVSYDIGIAEHGDEGRVITLEYEEYFIVTVYTPNSKRDLSRLEYRIKWEDDFRNYLVGLDRVKPVIVCGDMNVAHQEIDLKHPKSNRKNSGFTAEERGKFSELLASGFTDSFRWLYPDRTDAYSWWSYLYHARQNNAGWRIDYFLVSDRLRDQIREAKILTDVYGSDHCPVELDLF